MPYSFPQSIDRQRAATLLPHLLPGAVALAATAGYINSVVLGFFHTPVSHMTGAVSRLGLDVAQGRVADIQSSLTIVAGFVGGAALAGVFIGSRALTPGRRYGVALVVESALLLAATWLLLLRHRLGLPAVATACGLQNAMSSSYCGLAIRTTHVTGLATDAGVMLGHWLRHRAIDWPKFRFLACVFLGFGGGGVVGAVVDLKLGPISLVFPAAALLVAGSIFWWLAHRGRFLPATVAR